MLLTDKQIESLVFKEKDYKKIMGRGLYLIVRANHWKEWWVDFTLQRTRRSLRIGNFPEIQPEAAWRRAMDVKRTVMNNENPAEEGEQVILSNTRNNLVRFAFLEKRLISLENEIKSIKSWIQQSDENNYGGILRAE